MKRLILFLMVLGFALPLFSQVNLPEHYFASGSWRLSGDRLYQTDANARLAKVNMRFPQNGPMIYEFNVRYEGGIDNGHGGFGIHVFVDGVYHRASWGSGTSYLFWLNYDENPVKPGIQRGFTAQLYRSRSSSSMELLDSFDLNEYDDLLTLENWAQNTVPVKIWVNGNTGEARIYNPLDPDLEEYFYVFLPTRNLSGNWISLRTNGLSVSFGMGL